MEINTEVKSCTTMTKFLNSCELWATDVLEGVGKPRIKQLFHDCFCVNVDGEKSDKPSSEDQFSRKIHRGIMTDNVKYFKLELAESLEENQCEDKLLLLEKLREKYKGSTEKAWRPPYDARAHLRAERMEAKREQLNKLQLMISVRKQTVRRLGEQLRGTGHESGEVPRLLHSLNQTLDSTKRLHDRVNEALTTRNSLLPKALDP